MFLSNKDRCLKFWYHMNGSGIGSLSIFRSSKSSPLADLLWQKSGSQDNIWRLGRANLDLRPKPDNFTVLFQAQKGNSDKGKL